MSEYNDRAHYEARAISAQKLADRADNRDVRDIHKRMAEDYRALANLAGKGLTGDIVI